MTTLEPGMKINLGWMQHNDKNYGSLDLISVQCKNNHLEVLIEDDATGVPRQYFVFDTQEEVDKFIYDRFHCMETWLPAGPDGMRER